MSRRTWQLKMLVLAAEELEEAGALFEGEPQSAREPTWERLVSFAMQFAGRVEPPPAREEFDALRFMTIGQMFLPDGDIEVYHDDYAHHGDGVHSHRFQGQTLRHEHPGGHEPHGYYGHPEDVPPIGDPEHPTCGRCGVRRDVHDDGALGHKWQWNRPRQPLPAWQRAASDLREHGPRRAAELAYRLHVGTEVAKAALAEAVANGAVWEGPRGRLGTLYYAISHAGPPCSRCGVPPVIEADHTAVMRHADGCELRGAGR